MCGKFTAMASWGDVVDFADAFTQTVLAGTNDQPVGFNVISELRVIVCDAEERKRKVVPMRWGYPRRGSSRAPDPIHARSETIDTFAIAESPVPLRACVMVTVPANALIRTLTTEFAEADRMPAFLAKDDWASWLGESCSSPQQAKACLKTVEGIK